MLEIFNALAASGASVLKLFISIYDAWPMPWIGIITIVLGTGFGSAIAQFAKVTLKTFWGYKLGTAKLKWYSGLLAFVFGGLVASGFPVLEGKPLPLFLHALAAGLACPYVVALLMRKMRERDPSLADSMGSAFTGDDTGEFQQATIKAASNEQTK